MNNSGTSKKKDSCFSAIRNKDTRWRQINNLPTGTGVRCFAHVLALRFVKSVKLAEAA